MRQTKWFCDRCKKEIPNVFYLSNTHYRVSGYIFEKTREWEFCKDCAEKLIKFVEELSVD